MHEKISITKDNLKNGNRSERGVFFKISPAQLSLADGTTYSGFAPDWQTEIYSGEVVFNTGMTGYVESLTDPSYAGQILVFTYPLIGNYGVDLQSTESNNIQVAGVVVSQASINWSHSDADRSLLEWLHSEGVPILTGVDNRALTKHLRTKGTMVGAIATNVVKPAEMKPQKQAVSIDEPIMYNEQYKKSSFWLIVERKIIFCSRY